MPFTLTLPSRDNNVAPRDEQVHFDVAENLVIVGANGTGKSRFAAWIEDHSSNERVHRIAAQRVLTVPNAINLTHFARAERQLLVGRTEFDTKFTFTEARAHYRWNRKPVTHILDDYAHMLELLVALENKTIRSIHYNLPAGETVAVDDIPSAPIEKLLNLWSNIFPHRNVLFNENTNLFEAEIPETEQVYPANEMSDGERSVIYLAGQALCVPESSILIVDEPEVHLHKAILAKFWDELELMRSDCLFVYITHDLEFAASRVNAKKLVIEEFDGQY